MKDKDYFSLFQEAENIKASNKSSAWCNCIVTTKTGIVGIVDTRSNSIGGKVRVYTSENALLCDPDSLKIVGYLE
jgi:ribosomal protein S8